MLTVCSTRLDPTQLEADRTCDSVRRQNRSGRDARSTMGTHHTFGPLPTSTQRYNGHCTEYYSDGVVRAVSALQVLEGLSRVGVEGKVEEEARGRAKAQNRDSG